MVKHLCNVADRVSVASNGTMEGLDHMLTVLICRCNDGESPIIHVCGERRETDRSARKILLLFSLRRRTHGGDCPLLASRQPDTLVGEALRQLGGGKHAGEPLSGACASVTKGL